MKERSLVYNNIVKNIDIEKFKELKEYLESLEEDDIVYIEEDGDAKYAILPIGQYDYLDSFKDVMSDDKLPEEGNVKIITNMPELSYEEYETVKKQLIDVLEKNFKPKADKLN